MRDFLATTATLALVVSTPALAQSSTSDTPAAQATSARAQGRDDDIIVTARRREENIRDVPGTISAVTADQLQAKGPVTSGGDLINAVPGVRFNDVASENLAEVSIRGSGTQRATGADSGVGLFVNGAYVGSSTLGGRNFKTVDYFDLERVEVLEGPQGALYGRNSEFGVINLILAKPKFQNSGYVRNQFTFGLNQDRMSAVVNQALSDDIAVRVGAEVYSQTKGFYYNPLRGSYYDSTNGWNARGQIRYRSGPLDMTLLVDGQDLKLPSFLNTYVIPGGGVNPQIPLGYVQSRFTASHEGKDSMQQKSLRVMLTSSLDLGGGVSLESTTMATRWRSTQQFVSGLDLATVSQMRALGEIGTYPYDQTKTDVRDHTLYQDLHLTGKSGDLTWIVGGEGLYQRDTYDRTVVSSPCTVTLAASFCTGTPSAPVCIKPLPTSANCPTPFPLAYGNFSDTRQRIYSFAAYASLQYQIGDLTLVGEGRFSHDYKTATQKVTLLYTGANVRLPSTFSFKSDQPAWTFTASYKIPGSGGTLLYAKAGSGYRAGGVNNGSFNAAAPNPFQFTYGNENTIGYEAGVKSSIGRSLFVRVSGYLSRTHDAITSINDGCAVTNACLSALQIFNVNGGTIHAKGVEAALDGRFKAAGGTLSIALNAATQRATFVAVPAGISGLPVLNSPVAQIPDWTMSATLDYRHALGRDLNGFVNVSYSGQRGGGQDTVTLATPYIPMDDVDLFGSQVGLTYKNMQLAVFVRNLTDQAVQVLKFTQAGYPLSVRWNKPRTFGVTASYRW
ncbi:TonB-dependent receptor [Sphingomonas sp. KR3-1]|uniref:TonB-dependent receptor n=1 Tax=Sphingomonas sp. KR3-1 TaxID=3156611 RepID=UPI0032B563B6